jgi:hypothetical protein
LQPQSSGNEQVTITTYTGGCGTGIVDVNPHLHFNRNGNCESVAIELVNAAGAKLATSGNLLEQGGHWFDAGQEYNYLRWRAEVPRGGTDVHVYVLMNGELATDSAHCAT